MQYKTQFTNYQEHLMRTNFISLVFLAFALSTANSANSQEAIKVEVDNGSLRGQLIISLCIEETFLQDSCTLARTVVQTSESLTTTTIVPPKPGRYAISVAFDKNANGKLDRNLFGIPTEPVGLSRNPPLPKFGPPKFVDASFDYPSTNSLEFRIRIIKPD
jgi:uncharacterized protein (DUF2141 family)